MLLTRTSSSSHIMISDASRVNNLQRNIILSENEEHVSLVHDVNEHEAELNEKREDSID